jgi:hypothetical protein
VPLGRMPRRMRAALSAESVRAHPSGEEVPQEERVEAVERPGTLCYQVLAPLREQAQRLRRGLGIYRSQTLVARGGQRGCYGIEPVVLAGVAAREHSHPR